MILAAAFAAAALHAASFRLVDLGALGLRLQLAAIPCWPLFGLSLLLVTRGESRLTAWFDLCLLTLGLGLLLLLLGGALNLTAWAVGWRPNFLAAIHALDVLLADLFMARYFARRAPALGMSPRLAWALWMGVLNGAFVLSWLVGE